MAERKIRWTTEASISLLEILEFYTRRNKSKTYSIKLKKEIRQCVSLLLNHPLLGKEIDNEGIRELNQGVYQIYYVVDEKEISVLFVWDGRRDPNELRKFLEHL